MKVNGRSVWLAGIALALLGAASRAQSQSGKIFTRVHKPLRSAGLDVATGTVTRGPVVDQRAVTTVVDFSNTDLSGFVGLDTGNGFCEWFSAGVKGSQRGDGTADVDSGNLSDLMNSIVFAYCSAKADTASGGPGGSTKLGFYEGYTTGGGASTTAVAVFTLTGLPASTASSSFFGGFACYFIRVTFGGIAPFADGPIGYSWKFLDSGTGAINPWGAVVAATFPFLACVTSCSGFGPDGQGMVDVIDHYCPPGNLRASFTFGTATITSINMDIEEISTVTGTVVASNSSTFPNPDVLTSTPANVGMAYSASLQLGLARTKGSAWTLFFGSSLVNPPAGAPIGPIVGALNFGAGKAGRMLLCSIDTSAFSCAGAHTGVIGSVSRTNCGGGSIPLSLGLVCNAWCGQAVVLGPIAGDGNARLSSLITGVVGTN